MNWSILGALRFSLAAIVASSHLIYFERNPVALAVASLGSKAAVVGFLLVSGFSIAASFDRNAAGFYFRRFKRIYPVYFAAVLFGISLEWSLGESSVPFFELHPTGIMSAIGSLLMLQTFAVKSIAYNPVIWSLAVECAFYIAAPFLIGKPRLIAALCVISIGFYLMPIGEHGALYTAALKANAVKYFWPFGFGLLLYARPTTATFLASAAIGFIAVKLSGINYEPFAGATYVGSVAAIWLAAKTKGRSRFLDYLGDISYPLYLFQFPTFVLVFRLFNETDSAIMFGGALIVAAAAFDLIDVRLKPLLFSARLRPDQQPTLALIDELDG